MKIVIAGDGEVGFFLAKLLEQEYRDITLIDTQENKLKYVESELGIATVLGDSTSYRVLKESGIAHADLLIAVTSNESVNITTCLIGKRLGAKYTIARISNMEYLIDKETLDLKNLGIDDLISPESLAAREIKYILKSPVLTEAFEIEGGLLNCMGVFIDKSSPLVNRIIKELTQFMPDKQFVVAAINRGGDIIIPRGDTQFKRNDHLFFISTQKQPDAIFDFTGNHNYSIKNVLVIGGSQTGKYVALRLSKYYNITLIEKDIRKCNLLAKSIPNVQVICGDGTDAKLLEREKIYNYDAIVSLTGNSETNIFVCMMAKEYGVKKTVAMVENVGLFDHSRKLGIDSLINKKYAASNFIFRSIHKGGQFSQLYGIDAEILEFVVQKGAKAARVPIRELRFPECAIITGVVRNGQGFIASGTSQLEPNDKVFVFSMPKSSKVVKSFFC